MSERGDGAPASVAGARRALVVLALLVVAACGGRSSLRQLGARDGSGNRGAGAHSAGGSHGGAGSGGHGGAGNDCGPSTPVQLASAGESGSYFIDADDTHVYWSNAFLGTVMKIPRCGGALVTLAAGRPAPFMLAVDEFHVYWVNWVFAGSVERVPLGGGAVETLWSFDGQTEGVALDQSHLYIVVVADADGQTEGIWRLPKAGGEATRIHAGQTFRAIAVDDGYVYAGTGPDWALRRIPKSGGPGTILAQTAVLGAIALDQDHVYWSTWDGVADAPGNVLRVDKDGGSLEVIHLGEPGVVAGVAVDGTHVYWTSQQAGEVRARPKSGGPTLTLATGQGVTETVVTSGPAVFWVNFDDSSVWRAATP